MKITRQPAKDSAGADARRAAMIFYATGRTAEGTRALAEDPAAVDRVVAESGKEAAEVRAAMLAIAGDIAKVEAEDPDPERVYADLGLAAFLGPWPGAR